MKNVSQRRVCAWRKDLRSVRSMLGIKNLIKDLKDTRWICILKIHKWEKWRIVWASGISEIDGEEHEFPLQVRECKYCGHAQVRLN